MKLQQIWQTFSNQVFGSRWCLKAIAVITTVATVYGFYWYRWQLSATPAVFYPFVPDCPLAALFFLVVCTARLSAIRMPVLEQVAAFAAVKYGFWTVGVLLAEYLLGGALSANQVVLLISHVGLLGLGVAYWPQLLWSVKGTVAAVLWHAVNDFMDYVVGVHPYLPAAVPLFWAVLLALSTTIVLAGISVCTTKDFLSFMPNKRYTVSSILEERQEDV